MQFSNILEIFYECLMIFYHLPRAEIFQTKDEYKHQFATETIPLLNIKLGESILQFKVSTYPIQLYQFKIQQLAAGIHCVRF